jgi:uncharacterized protein YbjQ (UPF0145 family)
MRVTTLDSVAGRIVEDTLGVVRGSVMWARGLKKLSRGGVRTLEYMTLDDVAEGINGARSQAEAALIKQAEAMGADSIVGLKVEIVEMGAGMFAANATGTAVTTSKLATPAYMETKRSASEMMDLDAAANDGAVVLPFRQLKAATAPSAIYH